MRRLGLVTAAAEAELPQHGPTLRVALATQDGRTMNAHFGSARRFSVFEVSATSRRFVETVSFEDVSDESGTHTREGDDKNGAKIRALDGVEVLVVQAIGGPVAARVIRAQIHPVKISEPRPIDTIVDELRSLMADDDPPLWLRKLLQQKQNQGRSMDFLDDDDEDYDS